MFLMFFLFLTILLIFVGILISHYSKKYLGTPETEEPSNQNNLANYLSICDGKVIVFDFETNGLDPSKHSVLSCSAIKYTISNENELIEDSRFNRFYFPRERFNHEATNINGLTRKRIEELRGVQTYPKYFTDDNEFDDFCNGNKFFVAHNIGFDSGFYSPTRNGFCTMLSNTSLVKTKWIASKNDWKWPTLAETARFYNIDLNPRNMHSGIYDTEITGKILQKMLNNIKNSNIS